MPLQLTSYKPSLEDALKSHESRVTCHDPRLPPILAHCPFESSTPLPAPRSKLTAVVQPAASPIPMSSLLEGIFMEESQRKRLKTTDDPVDTDMGVEHDAGSEIRDDTSSCKGILYVIFDSRLSPNINIFAVDTYRKSMKHLLKLRTHYERIGCFSVGSSLYIIGGEYGSGHCCRCCLDKRSTFPLETYILDCCGREESKLHPGPRLQGPKPKPLVATVKGKIYALARTPFPSAKEPVLPPFEVLDPNSETPCWNPCAPPPFSGRYGYYFMVLDIVGPFVIEDTIFVKLDYRDESEEVYGYNVFDDKWYSSADNHMAALLKNEFSTNLGVWSTIVDKTLYWFESQGPGNEGRHLVFARKLICGSPCVRVEGLEDLANIRPKDDDMLGILTALSDDTLCLILKRTHLLRGKLGMVFCKFRVSPCRVEEQGSVTPRLLAEDVETCTHYLDGRLARIGAWCSM